MSHKKRGIALIACVMLIVFVSIAVLGVSRFIVERLSGLDASRVYINSLYLAQAGVHNALYNFRFHDLGGGNGYFSLGTTNIDTSNSFTITATAADILMVNTSAGVVSGPDLTGLRIQNATDSQPITIDRMIVTWNNPRRLTRIRINDSNVTPAISLTSPANVDITNFRLNTPPSIYPIPPVIYLINFIRFSGSMAGATINVQFVMTDGSTTRVIQVFPDVFNENNFTVRSTGSMAGSTVSRRIQAEYNAISGKIVNYREF